MFMPVAVILTMVISCGFFREPHFFESVLFILDKLHVNGHIFCGLAYDPNHHRSSRTPPLRTRAHTTHPCVHTYTHRFTINLNTQLCEQSNSKFTRWFSSLYAMKQFGFLFHLRHFIFMDQFESAGYSDTA